jgi:hypothetical protein
MNVQITDFVHDSLVRGVSREDIKQGLLKGGWTQKEIHAALDGFVECGLPVPVPRKRVSGSPKEAFLYLMLFSALYTAIFSIGSVLFNLINFYLPESAGWWPVVSLRYGIASVVVSFPVFLFMKRLISRESALNPGQRISPVRRWLTYLTLFVASASIVTDMIALIVRFLSGDMPLRFVLKVIVVALLAGIVFIYYLRDLRRDEVELSAEYRPTGSGRLGFASSILAVALIVGAGFWVAGTPARARLYSQDEQRVGDLSSISQCVARYYSKQGELPASLAACDGSPDTFIRQKSDRVTGQPYSYRVLDGTHYEVGATFALSSPAERKEPSFGYYPAQNPGFWEHGAGLAVFTVDVTGENRR